MTKDIPPPINSINRQLSYGLSYICGSYSFTHIFFVGEGHNPALSLAKSAQSIS